VDVNQADASPPLPSASSVPSSFSPTSTAPDSSPPTSAHPSAKDDPAHHTGVLADPLALSNSSFPVDAHGIALDWVLRLSAALSPADETRLRALFAPVAVLRDSLVFTWDLRSPAGPAAIATHMCMKGGGSQGTVYAFELDERPGLAPVVMEFDQPGAISLAFTFATPIGKGRGSARLFPRRHYDDDGLEEWIADSAYMMLDSIEGHDEERLAERPDPAVGHEIPWETTEAERRKKIEDEPYVLVGKFARCSREARY
jgi:hypothetical protein